MEPKTLHEQYQDYYQRNPLRRRSWSDVVAWVAQIALVVIVAATVVKIWTL